MGKAEVKAFADERATLVLIDLKDNNLKSTAKEYAPDAMLAAIDISSKEDISNLVKDVIEKYGHIDIVVNNAGVFDNFTPITDTAESMWDRCLNVNLKALYQLSQ